MPAISTCHRAMLPCGTVSEKEILVSGESRTKTQVLGLAVSLLAEKLLVAVPQPGIKADLVSQSPVIHGHLWAVIKVCQSSRS